MLEDPAEPRKARGAAMADITHEDLEFYGVEELEHRIADLQAEIDRTRAQLERKRSGRAAADALFRLGRD